KELSGKSLCPFWSWSSIVRVKSPHHSLCARTELRPVRYSITHPHFPVPWHLRSVDEQVPGSASWPSGPMQVWVWMHQNRPSLVGGTVGSWSTPMNCCFQRNAVPRVSQVVSKRS